MPECQIPYGILVKPIQISYRKPSTGLNFEPALFSPLRLANEENGRKAPPAHHHLSTPVCLRYHNLSETPKPFDCSKDNVDWSEAKVSRVDRQKTTGFICLLPRYGAR